MSLFISTKHPLNHVVRNKSESSKFKDEVRDKPLLLTLRDISVSWRVPRPIEDCWMKTPGKTVHGRRAYRPKEIKTLRNGLKSSIFTP